MLSVECESWYFGTLKVYPLVGRYFYDTAYVQ